MANEMGLREFKAKIASKYGKEAASNKIMGNFEKYLKAKGESTRGNEKDLTDKFGEMKFNQVSDKAAKRK